MKFEHGKAGLCEVTLAEGSPAIGKEIRSLLWPREASIVAIMRDGHVITPNGDVMLHRNDEVVVLVRKDSEDEVRMALIGAKS
jgi:trk system potassium uptake protein TrkA